MSYIGITTDIAIEFAKQGGDFTIMFQMIKIATASRLIHRLMLGEDVSSTWGAIINCTGCTKPVHVEGFDLSKMPLYRGFSLGTERMLVFRRLGTSYAPDENEDAAREAGHVYLAEKLISVAVDHERIFMTLEIDRVTGAHDFAFKPTG